MIRITCFLLAIFGTAFSVPISAPYYKPLTPEQASRLASWDQVKGRRQNIWQLSGQYEGDMVLTPDQRNGLIDTRYRWQNAVIPYELAPIFASNPSAANQIHRALERFAEVSCVKVRPREAGDVDYVYVSGENSGCWSYVGRLGGRQQLNLQLGGCIWDDIIIHEFLHAAGCGQYEGDMVLTPDQRNGLIDTRYRWQNAVIPYELAPIFASNPSAANQIHRALERFAEVSCVKVRPREAGDVDYVYVSGENSGCWSYVGRLGGRQQLNLQLGGCIWDDIIIHEFLHAAGFYHQQSATERDDYVTIMWENITPGTEHNFNKFGADVITSFGQPYDYYSVMHYDAWAFSFNGLPTVVPVDINYLNIIGQGWQWGQDFSEIDINKLRYKYPLQLKELSACIKMIRITCFLLAIFGTAFSVPITAPYYTPLTPEQASRLALWDQVKESRHNIWQLSGQYEGDMVLTPNQRNGLLDTDFRWEDAVIPYELAPIFDSNPNFADVIHTALERFAEVSCMKVRPREEEDVDYVYVTGDNSGCWSYVGRLGGRQQLNLQLNGCIWSDIIVHEFLHAAGFYHQQSATERDQYVTIMWDNIIPEMEHNFNKFGDDVITSFGEPYDYYSVMHYDAWAFSVNNQPTIVPVDIEYLNIIGQGWQWGQDFSEIDINKLRLMYCEEV
ncbi:Astacin (Peptidase family M12A) [Popillia japonica]|uniref:Metalloendopeptidase n=1 Tax=Popillia japonica TaxID=7064 RepID=A0AAW1ICR8_POPJA